MKKAILVGAALAGLAYLIVRADSRRAKSTPSGVPTPAAKAVEERSGMTAYFPTFLGSRRRKILTVAPTTTSAVYASPRPSARS
jgi:hypothetical protein